MGYRSHHIPLLLLSFLCCYQQLSLVEAQPNTTGYPCSASQTTYPCETYVFYRAMAPDYLDLASIGDLFSVSRLMIANPSNLSFPNSTLVPNQPLFVPIRCSCNTVNSRMAISYARLDYAFKSLDTMYKVSTEYFQNLTSYQSVEAINPTVVPENIDVGQVIRFPIFCKCPNSTQQRNQINYLVSYVLQPGDNLTSIASTFGVSLQSLLDLNGNNIKPTETVFVPVSRLPNLTQPASTPSASPPSPTVVTVSSTGDDRKGAVIGLGIGVGICGLLLILIGGLWYNRENSLRKQKELDTDEETQQYGMGRKQSFKNVEVNLMPDVSECLDKYKVFGIEQLKEATQGFDDSCVIQGSVYKGFIDGEIYAIKKMKWNAYEELKILQKVNHGNLVKLEGFCIDPKDANCYLVYEYVENGSLHSWLHGDKTEKLDWKTRLRIAIDVANGLQYIHEHTRPRVVHKDIKSSNILLDSNMRAKIANFGLAKSGCNAITMHIVGTQGYIAPEYLSDGVVSTKMDVFSFGVVLLELITGREAIDEEGKILWAKADGILDGKDEEGKVRRLKEWADGNLVQESNSMESIMTVMAVAVACLQRDPSKRPSMVDIVYALCKSNDFSFDISDEGLSPRPLVAR